MLTDQTNSLIRMGTLASPVDVAAGLLDRLATLPGGGGLHELDL
jgi:hypothetical protein